MPLYQDFPTTTTMSVQDALPATRYLASKNILNLMENICAKTAWMRGSLKNTDLLLAVSKKHSRFGMDDRKCILLSLYSLFPSIKQQSIVIKVLVLQIGIISVVSHLLWL